jgi:hypothetical protein
MIASVLNTASAAMRHYFDNDHLLAPFRRSVHRW